MLVRVMLQYERKGAFGIGVEESLFNLWTMDVTESVASTNIKGQVITLRDFTLWSKAHLAEVSQLNH